MSPWLPPSQLDGTALTRRARKQGIFIKTILSGFNTLNPKLQCRFTDDQRKTADSTMPWMFLDWFVPVYLLVSVLVLAGFGACLYFLEPGLQDAHKWSNKSMRHQPLAPTRQTHCRDDDSNALL
ncbi:hypothetical protein ABG768_000882 [Culter alburnus]|uniref:Uncharacterized protein n=2 Tax=Xenocypridinae TaxID=2743747 RepID=A0AAW2B5V1_CULAL